MNSDPTDDSLCECHILFMSFASRLSGPGNGPTHLGTVGTKRAQPPATRHFAFTFLAKARIGALLAVPSMSYRSHFARTR